MSTDQSAPVWARGDAFPSKPTSGAFGFQDTKGKRFPFDFLDDLLGAVQGSKHGLDLVWSPDSPYLVAPEELVALRPILAKRRRTWARKDIADGRMLSLLMGAAVLWAGYAGYTNAAGDWRGVLNSPSVAITCIMLLVFGLVPWYEGWKELRKSEKRGSSYWQKEVADGRFDSWLSLHNAPVTFGLLLVMLVTGVTQWWLAGSVEWTSVTVEKVALLKAKLPDGDPLWRYFTAPLVHGNLVHWLMNFAGLRYLARRAEVLARWPHMLIVFLISALAGGVVTVLMLPGTPSVGASGGIMGLLGFLLAFETLHQRLVPKSVRKRLIAGVVMMVLMGLLGFSFIDNAAHLGGFLAGGLYGVIVFPSSASVERPEILGKDRIAGAAAAVVLLSAMVFTVCRLFDWL